MAVHCGVHCTVHCACTVQNTVCAILLLEAWRHILCLWVAAVKVNVSLDWGCGTCKREFVQACVCTAINPKNLVLLRLLGSSFEDECVWIEVVASAKGSLFKLVFAHPYRKPKNLSRTESGFFKKTAILSNSLRRNLHAPFPPIQCCYIALLRKAFKKTAISVRMPACIGQQH